MFEKVSQAAERVATSVSRRGFLGKLGRGALGVAAALAGVSGVLARPGQARAGGNRCCCGYNPYRDEYYCRRSNSCEAGEWSCNCRKGCR